MIQDWTLLFYLLYPFHSPSINLLCFNSFWYSNDINLARAKFMVYSESIYQMVVVENSPYYFGKLIDMFTFKFFKINPNIVRETLFLVVKNFVLIEFMVSKRLEKIIVSYSNVQRFNININMISNFIVVGKNMQVKAKDVETKSFCK